MSRTSDAVERLSSAEGSSGSTYKPILMPTHFSAVINSRAADTQQKRMRMHWEMAQQLLVYWNCEDDLRAMAEKVSVLQATTNSAIRDWLLAEQEIDAEYSLPTSVAHLLELLGRGWDHWPPAMCASHFHLQNAEAAHLLWYLDRKQGKEERSADDYWLEAEEQVLQYYGWKVKDFWQRVSDEAHANWIYREGNGNSGSPEQDWYNALSSKLWSMYRCFAKTKQLLS